MHILQDVQNAFFDAMLAGYVMGGTKTTLPDMPGVKVITFESGDFRVVDSYITTPHSAKSAGTTTIWGRNRPVWLMQYGGEYPEHTIPFLKECLLMNYKERHFYGGRGPEIVEGQFIYLNKVENNDFGNFYGEESIHVGGQRIGFHWYRGMSLLKST